MAMPRVSATAAMPGSVKVACSIDRIAINKSRLTTSEMVEMMPISP